MEIATTKPTNTQRDLSLAYSPGVGAPCRDIAVDPDQAYRTPPRLSSRTFSMGPTANIAGMAVVDAQSE
nr:hypothetical protein [Halohasta litchfieldiae]